MNLRPDTPRNQVGIHPDSVATHALPHRITDHPVVVQVRNGFVKRQIHTVPENFLLELHRMHDPIDLEK